MRFLYFVIKFLPYWAMPSGLILLEVALIFRKRGRKDLFIRFATIAGLLFALTVCFFVFRWDVTLYPFLRDRLLTQ